MSRKEMILKKSVRKFECFDGEHFHSVPAGVYVVQFIHHGSSGKSTQLCCIDDAIRHLKMDIEYLKRVKNGEL